MGECLITRRGGEAHTLPTLHASYPANATVLEAATASATFSVIISTPGKPAEYTYQWYCNGAKISGATGASYTKAGLTTAGAYTLYCVVANKAGTVTSRVATLTVSSSQPTFTYTGAAALTRENTYDWRLTLKTSGTLKFTSFGKGNGSVQLFVVGGGGASGDSMSGGGGGGYTNTATVTAAKNTNYTITIGAGGTATSGAGGATSALGLSAAGGAGGVDPDGGNGGSGGGGAHWNPFWGGSNGSNGGGNGDNGSDGGRGQGTTTRAFGESNGELYAGGGGGGTDNAGVNGGVAGAGGGGSGGKNQTIGVNGIANTGGGAGGSGKYTRAHAYGGSGVVLIRNVR